MAKLDVKSKLPLNGAPAASIATEPALTGPAAPVGNEASAFLENVELKGSEKTPENLGPGFAPPREAEALVREINQAPDADREALLNAVEALRDDNAAAVRPTYAVGVSLAERIYIISAPGGPRRRANLSFGPEPRELVWEDLGETDEAREQALDALRADPLIKIDGRYEERPLED